MVAKISFPDYWKFEHGSDSNIPELTAKLIWDDAQRVERGWGVHGSCSRCSSDESPRTTATLCRKCYQNERKKKKKADSH